MSIIIRLQNLPLNAKSADIRNFFGGLRIPDGGVHILGGEKGVAFIAFMSDEDARLALRKDGGKIKDTRVKLFLSSRMEMQHEVEKITKFNFVDVSSHKMINTVYASDADAIKSRSLEMKRLSRSRSPHMMYDKWSNDKSRSLNEYHQMSRSPVEERMYGSRGSPKKRSRSPRRYIPSPRSPPFKSRAFIHRRKSTSPTSRSYTHSGGQIAEHCNPEHQSMTQSQLQAVLEKRITEELEKNYVYNIVMGGKESTESNIPGSIGVMEDLQDLPYGVQESYQQTDSNKNVQQDLISFLSSNHQFQENKFIFGRSPGRSQQENLPLSHSEMLGLNNEEGREKSGETFYVVLSGLDRLWNFREVQMMLKGIFAPQNHIRFERDRSGYKTGTVFVKLTNKDDFDSILKKKLISFNGFEINVSVCLDSVSSSYFPSNSNNENLSENNDFCYTLKGLPFSCTNDDVVNFFHGLEIDDLVIFYDQDGRATGTGFVSFKRRKDFEAALSQNGKKILHRYIEMLPCTQKDMSKAKKSPSNVLSFTPYSKLITDRKLPVTRRPLCALLTGLSMHATPKKVASFFSESGLRPDAIHLTISKNRLSDGRAFVEFTNFLDFDLALRFHGKQFDNNTICVKQILYDEMVKILDSQKAQHYFETPAPVESPSDVPEKVPYLWEPPDATEEQDKICNFSENYKEEHTNYYEGSTLQDRIGHSSLSSEGAEDHFIPNKNISIGKNHDSHDKREIFIKTEIISPFMIPCNTKLNPHEKRLNSVEGSLKEPIQISMNKNFDIKPKTIEPFSSCQEYKGDIKISRLSPENEAILHEFLNNRKANHRESNSFDQRKVNSYREKSLPKTKREHRDDKSFKSRYSGKSRNRNESDSRKYGDWKLDSYHRVPFQSDGREKEDRSKGCIVHLSNVSVSVGTQDLLNFLHGFDFYEDTLIRRYTVEGEPTRDVRVMFSTKREAERVISTLNKCCLHNKPIGMFIL